MEEKKEALLGELQQIEQELAGFDQEERQDDLVLEDWAGLLKVILSSSKGSHKGNSVKLGNFDKFLVWLVPVKAKGA